MLKQKGRKLTRHPQKDLLAISVYGVKPVWGDTTEIKQSGISLGYVLSVRHTSHMHSCDRCKGASEDIVGLVITLVSEAQQMEAGRQQTVTTYTNLA